MNNELKKSKRVLPTGMTLGAIFLFLGTLFVACCVLSQLRGWTTSYADPDTQRMYEAASPEARARFDEATQNYRGALENLNTKYGKLDPNIFDMEAQASPEDRARFEAAEQNVSEAAQNLKDKKRDVPYQSLIKWLHDNLPKRTNE